MFVGAVPYTQEQTFNSAFEYFQYAEQYFNTNDYITEITGHTKPSVGKPQVIYGTRQKIGDQAFSQMVILGASTLGKNPGAAMQRFRDNDAIYYRNIKPRAPKQRNDVVSIDFDNAELISCTLEEYIGRWKTDPEKLSPFNITANTPSKITHEQNGNTTVVFYIGFADAKDYVGSIKAASNLGVKSGNFTVSMVFDKDTRVIEITEHSSYKMSILTNPTVKASITETIKYESTPPVTSSKRGASTFVYNWV